MVSYSHLISLGYGKEGCHWTFFNASIGAQAYQTASLAMPEKVRQDAIEFGLKHRHWMGPAWGLMGQIGYMELEDGYDKYGVGVGFFKEF